MWTWSGRFVCLLAVDDEFEWLVERGYVVVAPD